MDAVYARQSVDKRDSVSIETQIEYCARAIDGGYTVYKDRGFSGKNTNRPEFMRMLEDIRQGKVSKVWVYRLDRFSRSILDFGQLWALLEQHHVEFESITEKFDTSTPSGRAMLNIIMTFAQLERETIAQRVQDNYYHRVALGSWPGGPAPLGFSIAKTRDDAGRSAPTLTANADMEIVRRIFLEYLKPGASLAGVARKLTREGICGIRRRGWDSVAISRILKNPVYVMADRQVYLHFAAQGILIEQPAEAFTGKMACHLVGKRNRPAGEKGEARLSLANHAGVIPPEVWLGCQEKLSANRQIDRSGVGRHSWLSGLLKCGGCGYAVKISRCGDTYYLHCSGHTNLGICEEKIEADLRELEDAVGSSIQSMLSRCPDEEEDSDSTEAEKLRRIDGQIERLVAAYAGSTEITAAYLNEEISRLGEERRALAQIRRRSGREALARIEFSSLSMAEKKMVASELIDRILLSGDRAEILWKV
ncbi:recombinase family protein [Oscillibacter sp. MSJ-2]|uniref:Recombinase family protein n=1 Tax=Dysosmobacter acutus TaxID=2841504 RepID=A0ABS6F8N9_9FIRM|nr:recombinase family protein [Dysosmobacter acutus]MBU5626658.1 recombinase family protein [Dysosmobacter acutus]